MNEKFNRSTGGLNLTTFVLVAVALLAVYIATSDASEWVQAATIIAAAVVTIVFMRITGVGRKSTTNSEEPPN